jgi:site-specific DNA-methyltransferase (adenine-specific)
METELQHSTNGHSGNFTPPDAKPLLYAVPSVVYNEDCVEGMKRFSDGYFDLAIVDPPYGIGKTWGKSSCPKYNHRKKYTNKNWNNEIPSDAYFEQLYRVSKHQIIWGCNYYNGYIKATGRIVWDKKTAQEITSACDLASQSFTNKIDIFRFMWDGYRQEQPEERIHPTQKPVALYSHLLKKYALDGWKILDTHLGSGSSRIACHKAGFEFVGFELDAEYYEKQEKRFRDFASQMRLF